MKTHPIYLTIALLVVLLAACSHQETDDKQLTTTSDSLFVESHFRPLYHYSPPKNWTNDPNGLVYHDGEYHLFFQYNPYGDKWGHMTWAHAVSKDLVNWENLPIAIPENEQDSIMIFSGSAVVDRSNSSGFGTQENPPLVAIYTAHYHSANPDEYKQNQHIAYSIDKGRTWTKYEKNPVLDLGKKDFRDPNVFWHEPSKQWIMSVVLPSEFKCLFYGSKDLKEWTLLSEFGEAGDRRMIWECPALVELPLEKGKSKWALLISAAHPDSTEKYVGMQYFVGEFDGKTFKNDNPSTTTLWLEYGKDFYAAIPWNQVPDKRTILYGWMNNWAYAGDVPTSPWRGQMSIPRSLSLQKYSEGIRIVQQPVKELESLRKKHYHFENVVISGISDVLKDVKGRALEIKMEVLLQDAEEFGIRVAEGQKQFTTIGYHTKNQQLYIDRTRSGMVDFNPKFPSRDKAPLSAENRKITLHIFLDHCSVEVFANSGKIAMTSLIFPDQESDNLSLFSNKGKVKVNYLDIWELGK